jgi:hypothetical protein
VLKASDFSKACRGKDPDRGSEPLPFLMLPTVLARTAVRTFHKQGATVAKAYLANSKVGEWANHPKASMATNNTRILDGFDWYVQEDMAHGRSMKGIDETAIVTIQGIDVETQIHVVLDEGNGSVGGRVVLWDGPDFDATSAPTIACVYAHALHKVYPSATYTTIGVWQGRRQYRIEVPHATAIAKTATAAQILAGM